MDHSISAPPVNLTPGGEPAGRLHFPAYYRD